MLDWGSSFFIVNSDQIPPEDGVLPITCPHCGTDTDSEIMSKFITIKNKHINLPLFNMEIHNYFLRCTRCKNAFLLLWSYGEDSRQRVSAGRIVYPYYKNAFSITDFSKEIIPEAIYEDIKQAELSYIIRAYLGSGLLLRRACQNICREKQAEGNNLFEEINSLCEKGFITKDMAEMAHNIRIIGNEIAHPDPSTAYIIDKEDIKECSEFIKQLIQVLYINPYISNRMKKRIEERNINK